MPRTRLSSSSPLLADGRPADLDDNCPDVLEAPLASALPVCTLLILLSSVRRLLAGAVAPRSACSCSCSLPVDVYVDADAGAMAALARLLPSVAASPASFAAPVPCDWAWAWAFAMASPSSCAPDSSGFILTPSAASALASLPGAELE